MSQYEPWDYYRDGETEEFTYHGSEGEFFSVERRLSGSGVFTAKVEVGGQNARFRSYDSAYDALISALEEIGVEELPQYQVLLGALPYSDDYGD